jgi:hypothetical protein
MCAEEGCFADISHKANRSTRCDTHQKAYEAAYERSRYAKVKDAVGTRRRLRRQGAAEYEAPRGGEVVVDYTQGGDQRPSFRQATQNNIRHDTARRVQMDMAAKPAELEPGDWEEQQQARAAAAPSTALFPAAVDVGENVFYGGRQSYRGRGEPVSNPAALGLAIVAPNRPGVQAVAAQKASRFGPDVDPPVQVTAGMLAAPPSTMVDSEQAVVAEEKAASDHMRSLAGYASWRRR